MRHSTWHKTMIQVVQRFTLTCTYIPFKTAREVIATVLYIPPYLNAHAIISLLVHQYA